MGTTLTGTTPATTYDSLIKVTDNGPLSATAKYLSDGLGNDSSLALSTGFVGIGNIPSNAYDGYKLQVGSIADSQTFISIGNSSSGLGPLNGLVIGCDSTGADIYQRENQPLRLHTNGSERMRIDSAGNVGIGTSSPSGKLHVAGGDIFLGASYALKYNSTSYITPENNVSGAEVSTGGVFVVKTGVSPAERLRVDASGNVGIGTGSPAYRFNVVTDAIAGAQNLAAIDRTAQNFVTFTNPQFSTDASMGLLLRVFPQSDARQGAGILASGGAANGETDLNLFVSSGTVSSTSYSALTLKGGSGWVGIGTTSPASKMHVQNGALQVSGNSIDTIVSYSTVGIVGTATAHDLQIIRNSAEICRVTANGLTFNGDTAANNALSDYEQGTFTATITPATSGTITSGGTFTTWTYTKIGRQVTISGVFVISSVASPVGATVIIGGLPFTIFNNNGAYGAFSAAYFTSATSADSAVSGRHSVNTTQLTLGVDASTVAASDEIYVTATYFV